MKKYWKIGSAILLFLFVIAVFSIFYIGQNTTTADKNQKSTSDTNPQIAQRRMRRLSPVFQEIMKEEGINPEDLRNNPELRKKLREKVNERRSEIPNQAPPKPLDNNVKPVKKEVAKIDKKAGEDSDYYKVIIEKNLFRPLGSGAEQKGPSFALLGTVIAKTKGDVDRALIMNYQRNQSVYVAEGEKIGDARVEKIEPRHVTLFHEGEMKDFYIQEVAFIGSQGRGGGRRGGPSGRGAAPQQMRQAPTPNKMQQAKEMKRIETEKMEEMRRNAIKQRGERRSGRRSGVKTFIRPR